MTITKTLGAATAIILVRVIEFGIFFALFWWNDAGHPVLYALATMVLGRIIVWLVEWL